MSDAPARHDRNDDDADRTSAAGEDVAFSASASAPSAPVRGPLEDDREVEFGVPYSPPMDASRSAEDSFERGRLDHPHWTRPAAYRGREVPGVLRSGDHAAIARWRERRASEATRSTRPDLPGSGEGAEDP